MHERAVRPFFVVSEIHDALSSFELPPRDCSLAKTLKKRGKDIRSEVAPKILVTEIGKTNSFQKNIHVLTYLWGTERMNDLSRLRIHLALLFDKIPTSCWNLTAARQLYFLSLLSCSTKHDWREGTVLLASKQVGTIYRERERSSPGDPQGKSLTLGPFAIRCSPSKDTPLLQVLHIVRTKQLVSFSRKTHPIQFCCIFSIFTEPIILNVASWLEHLQITSLPTGKYWDS